MLATKLKQFFNKHDVCYHILNHERNEGLEVTLNHLELDASKGIKAEVIKCGTNFIIAVMQLYDEIDHRKLEIELNRKCYLLSHKAADRFFYDCEPGSHPPFGEPYGLSMIIDTEIEELNSVYFKSGCHNSIIHMSMDEFSFLTNDFMKLSLRKETEGPNKPNKSQWNGMFQKRRPEPSESGFICPSIRHSLKAAIP